MGRLSKEEQAVLVKSAQLGDVSAFQKLVEELSPFVKYVENTILNGYEANGTELKDVSKEDIYLSGIVGLIKSVYKYDSSFDVAFSTYAYSFIAEEIRKQLGFELNRTGITGGGKGIAYTSIDEDNGLVEHLEAMEISTLDEIIGEYERNETRERISKAFESLTENEKKVLFMIHGIDCEKTSNHRKIAKELGISEMMVKVTINDAIRKISKAWGE